MPHKLIARVIIYIISSLFIISCKQPDKEKAQTNVNNPVKDSTILEAGEIISHATPEGLSYSIYSPANFSADHKYSIIIFLDPHGKGSYPLNLYKSLADKFEVLLVGSNDSKNGISIENGIHIVEGLFSECKKLPYSNGTISVAGFSGGAKMALLCGTSISGFSSVIYSGAALPEGSVVPPVPLLGYAGKKDMNYTEVKNFSRFAKSSVKESGVAEWPGKHEWPDSGNFEHAFYWHLLSNKANRNDRLISDYKNYIDNLVKEEKNPLRKVEYLNDCADLLDKFIPVDEIKKEIRKIILSSDYNKAKSEESKILAAEDLSKQMYMESFTTQNLNWWSNEIRKLSAGKNESNKRLLGYISLASWSYSTKAVESNDVPFSTKALTIYQLCDPENPEHEFLKACLYAKNNYPDSAIFFLNEAVKLGLDDRAKVDNAKDLAMLRERNEFNELLGKLKY